MKRGIKNALAPLLLFIGCQHDCAQGTFVNLDFESPILPLVKDLSGFVPIANALPGWIGYGGTNQVTTVRLNNIALGSAEISFHGPDSFERPFHGNYSVFLQGGLGNGELILAAIGQVGQIPASARSVLFYTDNLNFLQLTFAGQLLPVFNLTGGIFGYQEYGADVSSLAGRTGELRFTGGSGNLDFIQFSMLAHS